ncbi:MAG: hypothetical protein JRN24_01805, partial [Nitrososphaerota archaeon]|nr:hypothetical protein [Nitrososphaerota archaeon]
PLQCFLEVRASQYRFAVTVRNDHPLKGEFEHRSESGQFALFVPCPAVPNSKFSAPFGKGIPEHNHAMLRKPHGGLKTPPSVVEGDQSTWELAICDNRL